MIKVRAYFDIFLNLKAVHAGTITSRVIDDDHYRSDIKTFSQGVLDYIDVEEIICRYNGETVINTHDWNKLSEDENFRGYIARVLYAIQSAEDLFDDPDDWNVFFANFLA
jgi:hypothetical protein